MTLVEIGGVFINPEHVVAVAPAGQKDTLIWCIGGPQQNIKVEGTDHRRVATMLMSANERKH